MSVIEFQYRAVDKGGVRRTGTTRAASRNDAYRQVAAMGLVPTELVPAAGRTRRSNRGVKRKDVSHLAFQMSVLIGARIPLGEGLRSIAEQETKAGLKEVVSELAARVEAGEAMSSAMRAHVGVFGDVFVETVKAAEHTGNLTKVLEYLAETLERAEESKQQVKSALMYPAVVVTILVLAVLFLVGFVIPKFAVMYAARGVELPWLTRMLMAAGGSLSGYWWAYLGMVVAGVVGARMSLRTERGRLAFDRMSHSIPYVNRMLVGSALARFCRVFSLCLTSGLNLLEGLEMAGRSTGRAMLQEDVSRLVTQVRTGGRLSGALSGCRYFPAFSRRMLSAGEESGELPKMCAVIARQYERETGVLVKNFATVVEPALVVMIAGVVAVVALAIFLPMWNMVTLLK